MKIKYSVLALVGLACTLAFLLAACRKEPEQYTITGNALPQEAGTVRPAVGVFTAGEALSFRATPADQWEFSHWEGDLTGSENPCAITVTGPMNVTGVFTRKQYPLDVAVYGQGKVHLDVLSTATKADLYDYGSVVRLTAQAEAGWTFDRWTGSVDEKAPVCTLTVAEAAQVQAVFLEDNGGFVPQLGKGVNITGWFQYVDSVSEVIFSTSYRKELENIKSLGLSTVRLPIDFYALTGPAPDYTVPDALFVMLDYLVNWAQELGLNLILDNHSSEVPKSPTLAKTFLSKLWAQLADHFSSAGDGLLYEIQNEPYGAEMETAWADVQSHVLDVIRSRDQRHYVVVGAPGYNTYTLLENLPVYKDSRLVYTFHYYDPFLFTHQGASWAGMEHVTQGIPFPYDASRMPDGYESDHYDTKGTVQAVYDNLDYAVRFLQARQVPLLCGEFGVYRIYPTHADRVYWHQIVREYLDANGIAWALWTYNQGEFCLFKENTDEIFEHDLDPDMIHALGLTMPPQTPVEIVPDMQPVVFYDDYLSGNMTHQISGVSLDYYCTTEPYDGSYCLKYSLGDQYTALSWGFKPVRDFSWLKDNGYALTCRVKMSRAVQLQFRFQNAQPYVAFPWRLAYDVPASDFTADGQWHTLTLPLSQFEDVGGWDQTWFNGCGLADWSRLSYFQISNEMEGQYGTVVYIDVLGISK